MLAARIRDEAGYSLVEVMVSIVILAIAIVPMVGMFDAGLKSATLGGNYDQARTLAQKELETAQGSAYSSVRSSFPSGCPSGSPGTYNGNGLAAATGCSDAAFSGFTFDVEKQYLEGFNNSNPQNFSFAPDPNDNGAIQIKVTVKWQGGHSYTVTGFKMR